TKFTTGCLTMSDWILISLTLPTELIWYSFFSNHFFLLFKPDPCILPLDEGNCSKFTLRWYYHRKAHECRPFIYSGCNGNANQFPAKEDCEQACKLELAYINNNK
uniref:BPTI/Kunitz inhibitor domain-containing protein n=1 Tax=Callorhinchus milii TaxID=7868 RepID=A0A4W3K2J5_CALMI